MAEPRSAEEWAKEAWVVERSSGDPIAALANILRCYAAQECAPWIIVAQVAKELLDGMQSGDLPHARAINGLHTALAHPDVQARLKEAHDG